tara:strand:- start:450 stop:1199 length:750 start_codon:yes stop_codon:yes gene_type:complete
MKKTAVILVLVCLAIAGGLFLYKKDDPKSHLAHTVMIYERPYQPLDGIRSYFSEIGWAGTVPIGTFIRHRFGDDVISNLDRIRFDLPDTEGYEVNPTVQYYHPKGGGAYGAKLFAPNTPSKEVLPESTIYYTFGNAYAISEEKFQQIAQKWQRRGVKNEQTVKVALSTLVTAVVTQVREEMCPVAVTHPVSSLPWPQRPSQDTAIKFETMRVCYQHPDGWYYYIFPAYTPNYTDAIQHEKVLESFGEDK